MADIAVLCSFCYHNLRINEHWEKIYPYVQSWFTKLHTIDSVQSTITPQKQ